MSAPPAKYIPALRFHWLTALYDPMIRVWTAAAQMRASVIDALDLRPGQRLLELGSGSGRLAIEIKRRFPDVTIHAVDRDASMIERARRNAHRAGVDITFHEADMTTVEPADYDRAYSTMVFHHLCPEQKTLALAAARRALHASGHFVVADFGRPRGLLQTALFALIQEPLDGVVNTRPHRDGRFETEVRAAFTHVQSSAVWRTAAGTIEMLVCRP